MADLGKGVGVFGVGLFFVDYRLGGAMHLDADVASTSGWVPKRTEIVPSYEREPGMEGVRQSSPILTRAFYRPGRLLRAAS